MSLLSSGRLYKQYAVYWEPNGTGPSGQPVYKEPRVIKCRWENRVQQFLSKTGQTQISRSIVYVPEDLKDDGYLWLSSVRKTFSDTEDDMVAAAIAELTEVCSNQEDGTDVYHPQAITNAWQIRHRDTIPDLRARSNRTLRIVIL